MYSASDLLETTIGGFRKLKLYGSNDSLEMKMESYMQRLVPNDHRSSFATPPLYRVATPLKHYSTMTDIADTPQINDALVLPLEVVEAVMDIAVETLDPPP
ncbi:hypothetical protein CVT25_014401 [Psilocybe cyanescens]|uniref:Uncharacterized protein n=1 Tax=Psilocybe cyanescens TaxID=93625 RepID=A0A409XBK5_PSICY|nr:hypothetical protein CVT25_014401 [Psilocybe cyanescens]